MKTEYITTITESESFIFERTWFETLNSQKQIIQVRPEFGNGVKIHYRFDNNGNYIGKW